MKMNGKRNFLGREMLSFLSKSSMTPEKQLERVEREAKMREQSFSLGPTYSCAPFVTQLNR